MRIAEICPDCATYINASCILYDGPYLPNLDISPLDSLEDILIKLDGILTTSTTTTTTTDAP